MIFKQWLKQAHGVDTNDSNARFTVYNMEVAYTAGNKEGEANFAFMCSSAKLGAFSKHSEYDAVVVDLEKYDRMVEMLEEQQEEIERLQKENDWISVKDALPEKYRECLVYPWISDYIFTAELQRGGWAYTEYITGYGAEVHELTKGGGYALEILGGT